MGWKDKYLNETLITYKIFIKFINSEKFIDRGGEKIMIDIFEYIKNIFKKSFNVEIAYEIHLKYATIIVPSINSLKSGGAIAREIDRIYPEALDKVLGEKTVPISKRSFLIVPFPCYDWEEKVIKWAQ